MTKRILSLVMALAMVLSMVPAFAAEATCTKTNGYCSLDKAAHEAAKSFKMVEFVENGNSYCAMECVNCGGLVNYSKVAHTEVYVNTGNKNEHRVDCSTSDGCGAQGIRTEAHTTGTFNSNGVAICTKCGWVDSKATCTHNYVAKSDNSNLVDLGNGTHAIKCSVCGFLPEASDKNYTTAKCSYAGANGEDKCVCGAVNPKAHKHDWQWKILPAPNADYHGLYCEECGVFQDGSAVKHGDNAKWILNPNNEKTHIFFCSVCEEKVIDPKYNIDEYTHNGGVVKFDAANHWQTCAHCEGTTEKIPHTLEWTGATTIGTVAYDNVLKCTGCDYIAAYCEKHVATVNKPTCISKGICDNCGKTMGKLAPHNYEPLVDLDDGVYHASVCTVCGAVDNKAKHDYDLIGSDAICVCGAKKVGCTHNWEEVPAVPTSCLSNTDGATKGIKCSECGTWKLRPTTIKAGHTFLKEMIETPECFKDGKYRLTCTVEGCGYITFETIDHTKSDLAHDLVFVEVTKKAACNVKGEELWKCSNPNCTYTTTKEIPALKHVTTKIKVDYDKNGNLTDELSCIDGIYTYTGCENCSYRLSPITMIPNSKYATHNLVYAGAVKGSCTSAAGYLFTCSHNDCEYSEIHATNDATAPAVGAPSKYHDVTAGVIVHEVSATCFEAGSKWYECPTCGKQIAPDKTKRYVDSDAVFTIAKLQHTNAADPKDHTKHEDANWIYTAATCEEFGYWESNCSVCNANYRKVVDYKCKLAAHNPIKGKALTPEVCEETADYEQICEYCGIVLGSLDNQPVSHKMVPNGAFIKVGKYCNESDFGPAICERCGEYTEAYHEFKPTAAEAKHEFVLTTKPATCEAPAFKGYVCVKCGKVDDTKNHEEFGEVLPHKLNKGTVVNLCQKGEAVLFECVDCDYFEYVVVATGAKLLKADVDRLTHNPDKKWLVKNDCTTDGLYIESVCKDCGYVIDADKVAVPGGHTKPADFETNKAKYEYKDCTGKYETYTCTVCNLKIEKLVDKKDKDLSKHREPAYDLIKAFTCTESGFGYEMCTACGYKAEKPAVIEAQHVFAKEPVVIVPATCGKDGYGKIVCTVCGEEDTDETGKVYYVTIPATEKHVFAEKVLKSGICTQKSYVIYECSVCGAAQEDEKKLAKAGYADGYINNNAGEDFYYLDPVENEVIDTPITVKNVVEVVPFTGKCDFGNPYKVEATCTEGSGIAETCKVCGYKHMIKENNDALGHDPVTTTVKPTCYLDGSSVTVCYVCGVELEKEVLDKTNHDMVAIKNDIRNVAATCKTTGIAAYACKLCGYEELRVTEEDASNHNYATITEYKAADCKTGVSGLVHEKCLYCGHEGVHTVAPAHTYVDTAVKQAPTCDVAGIMTQTCSVCEKATREVSIPRVAHVMITEEVAADCIKDAGIVTRCANCDLVTSFVKTGAKALGHKFGDKVFVPATCTTDGGYKVSCLREGCTESSFTVAKHSVNGVLTVTYPKLNHKGKTLVKEIKATCQSPAYAIYNCPICKTEITEIAGAIDRVNGHDWKIKSTYGYEPTCAKPGYVDRECALCGVSSNRIWHTPEHTWSDYVYSKDYVYRLCLVCGEVDSIYVSETFAGFVGCTTVYTDPITGNRELRGEHKGLVVKPGKEGTCEEAGQIEDIRCTVCGTVIADGAVIPAHNVTVIEAKAATCTEEGNTAGKYCETCKEYIVKPETIAKVAHTVVEVPAVDATATTAGTTAGKKCSVCGEILEGCEPVAKLGATVKRLCVVRSKAADYREDATSEVVKMLAEGTAVVITGELVNEYYPVEGGYIHMSYITVA